MGRGKKSTHTRKNSRKEERKKLKTESQSSGKGYKGVGRVSTIELDQNQEDDILNFISIILSQQEQQQLTPSSSSSSNLTKLNNKKSIQCKKLYKDMNSHDKRMMIKSLIRTDRFHRQLEDKKLLIERNSKFIFNQTITTHAQVQLDSNVIHENSDVIVDINTSDKDTETYINDDDDNDDDNISDNDNDNNSDDDYDEDEDGDSNSDLHELADLDITSNSHHLLSPPPPLWHPPSHQANLPIFQSPRCFHPQLSLELLSAYQLYQQNADLSELFKIKESLPIFTSKSVILDTIRKNQICIISGECAIECIAMYMILNLFILYICLLYFLNTIIRIIIIIINYDTDFIS